MHWSHTVDLFLPFFLSTFFFGELQIEASKCNHSTFLFDQWFEIKKSMLFGKIVLATAQYAVMHVAFWRFFYDSFDTLISRYYSIHFCYCTVYNQRNVFASRFFTATARFSDINATYAYLIQSFRFLFFFFGVWAIQKVKIFAESRTNWMKCVASYNIKLISIWNVVTHFLFCSLFVKELA